MSNGFSISYSHVMGSEIFTTAKMPQDSLAFELGAIIYSRFGLDGTNSSYNFLPFYVDLLYQLHASEVISFNLYGGLQYNYIASYTNKSTNHDNLTGFQPNFGFGFFYTIGPQWCLRADVGWDRITGGLSLKW